MKQDELLNKWLNGELNDAEWAEFKRRSDYDLNSGIIETAAEFKAGHFSKPEDFKSFKATYNQHKDYQPSLSYFKYVLRVAAILVIGLGIYFTLFSGGSELVQTAAGEKIFVMLPDNSEVHLNSVSKIEYNVKRWEDNRNLILNGEAFFKVAKGKKFDVVTTDGIVSVLGTQFNVKQRPGYFEVKCFEGMVRVSRDTILKDLKAGMTLSILNGELNLGTENEKQPSWMDNFSRFKAIPFSQVTAEIERQYDVEIDLPGSTVNRLFTGRFTHDNLEQALKEITVPMNLNYLINGSIIRIYGQNED
ncbi:MAG: FecR family protein [Flavobacteriaceae bacterium]|nr:FecR family protein [Flavobacteriaceae bacterium]